MIHDTVQYKIYINIYYDIISYLHFEHDTFTFTNNKYNNSIDSNTGILVTHNLIKIFSFFFSLSLASSQHFPGSSILHF